MLLRASGELVGQAVDVHALTDPEAAAQSGVAHGDVLLRFAEAVLGRDDALLERARQQALDALGPDAFVDAAAVVGNFQRMVRIADGTGIPLDTPVNALSTDLQSEIGIDAYASAANTPPLETLARSLGRLLRPVTMPLLRLVARTMRTER